MKMTRVRKFLYFIGLIALTMIGAIAFLLWRGVSLPQLGGPYKIGRTNFHFVDSSRKEIFSEQPNDYRELMVTVHYPANVTVGQTSAPYADDRLSRAISEAYHIPRFVFSLLHSHAVEGAPCAQREGGYPIVIFSPGFNTHPLFYTALLEELASQGFVVVSVSHPYSTGVTVFPDGRMVRANDMGTRFEQDKKLPGFSVKTMIEHREAIGEVWVADVRFVLDSLECLNKSDKLLAGNLDIASIGIFGHSFGGATATAAVQCDTRFRAGINMDGTDFSTTETESLSNSVLWLLSVPPVGTRSPLPKSSQLRDQVQDVGSEPTKRSQPTSKKESERSKMVLRGNEDQSMPTGKFSSNPLNRTNMKLPPNSSITLSGSQHQTFTSDITVLASSFPFSFFMGGSDVGTIDGRRAVFVIDSLVVGFFRKHLRGEKVPFLDHPSSEFPEAALGKKQP